MRGDMRTIAKISASVLFGVFIFLFISDRQTFSALEKKKVKDLVCGMEIDPGGPNTLKVERGGKTYYFCSASCKAKFLANPEKYIGKQPADEVKMAKDPVCGMELDPKMAGVLRTEYKGKTYYFCGEDCKKSFDADPEKYLKKGPAPSRQSGVKM